MHTGMSCPEPHSLSICWAMPAAYLPQSCGSSAALPPETACTQGRFVCISRYCAAYIIYFSQSSTQAHMQQPQLSSNAHHGLTENWRGKLSRRAASAGGLSCSAFSTSRLNRQILILMLLAPTLSNLLRDSAMLEITLAKKLLDLVDQQC